MAKELLENRPVRPPGKVSFEDFLTWCDEDVRSEWLDGAVIVVSPPSTRHQEVTGFLLQVAGMFVQSKDLGTLLFAPYLMHLPDIDRAREPDLLFVRRERTHLITRNYLAGPPTWWWRLSHRRVLTETAAINSSNTRKPGYLNTGSLTPTASRRSFTC